MLYVPCKIAVILRTFRGLREIAGIKGMRPKQSIDSIQDSDGNTFTDPAAISDVFATFYEHLYRRRSPVELDTPAVESTEYVPIVFSMENLQTALKSMKRGKAGDDAGIIAEMIKDGSQSLRNIILTVFNEVTQLSVSVPSSWKKSRLTVIFKKGDQTLPKNYRPIALLSILYKLFSRMLCDHLAKMIIPRQGPEQGAYRPGYSTEDHLLAAALLIERSHEYKMPLWIATVDFEKAFDTVEQPSLWNVLLRQGVPSHYVTLLKNLYQDQCAYVCVESKSRDIPIQRGVRQGDPLSALLFIAVMQDLCGSLQERWAKASARRKGHPFGIDVANDGRFLTNLRFADDVLLVAQSRVDLNKMLVHFSQGAANYGLKVNYEKTKVLTWNYLSMGCPALVVGDCRVEVLAEDAAEKYLGRKLCFHDSQLTELNHRIASAWASFHKHKAELCGKYYPLKDRARLFEAVVTATLVYGCSAWALTRKMEHTLITVRRRMLRYVIRIHRQASETWVEYLQLDVLSATHNLQTWVANYRQRKL